MYAQLVDFVCCEGREGAYCLLYYYLRGGRAKVKLIDTCRCRCKEACVVHKTDTGDGFVLEEGGVAAGGPLCGDVPYTDGTVVGA